MKSTVPAFAVASALALTACTTTGPRATAHNPLSPQISVVTGAIAEYIVVDQDPIVVTRKGKSRVVWSVVTAGYEFDRKRNGIVFTLKSGKGGQLTGCGIVSATQFACDNDNNGKGVYTYEIFLTGPMGRALKVDPSYVND